MADRGYEPIINKSTPKEDRKEASNSPTKVIQVPLHSRGDDTKSRGFELAREAYKETKPSMNRNYGEDRDRKKNETNWFGGGRSTGDDDTSSWPRYGQRP